MLFNFMTNLGPERADSYLLAGEVFPTRVRGMGAGFAAAFAKIALSRTAFCSQFCLVDIGTQALLTSRRASLLGAIITWLFRIDTTGVSLEADWEFDPPRDAGSMGPKPRSDSYGT